MQVHAVPDAERAFDSTGRKLPWAYDFADSDQNQRRVPEERGPFGKARQRGASRAKTPTNRSEADNAKLDNERAIDDIFGRFKQEEDKKRSINAHKNAVLPTSISAPNLIDASNGLGTSFGPSASTNAMLSREPKEVILYGYGIDAQWAAVSHYEKISNGVIYEEYDREPYNPKFGYSFASQRASHYRSLTKPALRKVNEFVGGNHWIKVTFDSVEAAEMACHYSPKSIQGCLVYAEMYRGTPPSVGDVAIRADAGAASRTASPNTLSSGTLGLGAPSQSSATASSTTAIARASSQPDFSARYTLEPTIIRRSGVSPTLGFETLLDGTLSQPLTQGMPQISASTTALASRADRATLRIKGAKAIGFLPPEKAFLPAQSRWQQTLGSLPIIGWAIGSGQGIIGDHVPRKEDGTFDLASASLYWRLWYAVDCCFGSDFCGTRDMEYDE